METPINHVSDTALWVAHYRAKETARPNPLFRDPFAERLTGDKGAVIASARPPRVSEQVEWSVTIRTVIIDDYVERLVAQGVDTVINLGAGLDARPYRMKLPRNLRWIEVDYDTIIHHKARILASDEPQCLLEQIPLDLANRSQRQKLFSELAQRSSNVLILTEGLIPYLSETQVAELAQDLRAHRSFQYWLTEYYSPEVYKYFQSPKHMSFLKNARFQFFPANWFTFFQNLGWQAAEKQYLGEWGHRIHRPMPMPRWVFLFFLVRPFMTYEKFYRFRRLSAYILLRPF